MADVVFSPTINAVTSTSAASCNITRSLGLGGWLVGGYLSGGWLTGGIISRTAVSSITISVSAITLNFIYSVSHGELYDQTISSM